VDAPRVRELCMYICTLRQLEIFNQDYSSYVRCTCMHMLYCICMNEFKIKSASQLNHASQDSEGTSLQFVAVLAKFLTRDI
jgi:hypothetical protein